MRRSAPFFRYLAAAAVVVAATVVTAAQQTATAVAQENENQNDPANVTAAETIVVTHIKYLRNFFAVNYRSFQDIPQAQKGYLHQRLLIPKVRRGNRRGQSFLSAQPQPQAYRPHR